MSEITFQVEYAPRETKAELYGEWETCVGCGKDAICLTFDLPDQSIKAVRVCKECVGLVFEDAERYYQNESGKPLDTLSDLTRGLPVEDAIAIQNAVAARTMRRFIESSGGVGLEFTDGDGSMHWIYVSAALADEICPPDQPEK
jgi:hypothetical protein